MLLEFGFKTEAYFGIFAMTSTVHAVVEHFAHQVLNWGPLFAQSCYPFEYANRQLLRVIQSPIGVNLQIMRYLNLCHSVLELEKKILPDAPEVFAHYYNEISHKKSKDSYRLGENRYFSSSVLDNDEQDIIVRLLLSRNIAVDMFSSSTMIFNRLLRKDYMYCSTSHANKRTDSSFALMKNGNIVHILKFLILVNEKVEYIVCKIVNTTRNKVIEHYKPLREISYTDQDIQLLPTIDIEKVCVHMEISDKSYICELPNPYSLYT